MHLISTREDLPTYYKNNSQLESFFMFYFDHVKIIYIFPLFCLLGIINTYFYCFFLQLCLTCYKIKILFLRGKATNHVRSANNLSSFKQRIQFLLETFTPKTMLNPYKLWSKRSKHMIKRIVGYREFH